VDRVIFENAYVIQSGKVLRLSSRFLNIPTSENLGAPTEHSQRRISTNIISLAFKSGSADHSNVRFSPWL
jgi:hypothetical protein